GASGPSASAGAPGARRRDAPPSVRKAGWRAAPPPDLSLSSLPRVPPPNGRGVFHFSGTLFLVSRPHRWYGSRLDLGGPVSEGPLPLLGASGRTHPRTRRREMIKQEKKDRTEATTLPKPETKDVPRKLKLEELEERRTPRVVWGD